MQESTDISRFHHTSHLPLEKVCLETTCQNGGTCVPDASRTPRFVFVCFNNENRFSCSFRCDCVDGYEGDYCEHATRRVILESASVT